MKCLFARLVLIATTVCVTSLAGCAQSPGAAGQISSVQTQARGRGTLQVFHQSVLYDRRGNGIDAIMRHHTFVLINRTAAPLQLDIKYTLGAAQAKQLDLDSYFGIMLDILPAGVGLPAVASMVQLPAPAQEKASDGGVLLHWASTLVSPDTAAILFFGAYEQDGAAFRLADHAITDMAGIYSTSTRNDDSLALQYRVVNTSSTDMRGMRLGIFVPNAVLSEDGSIVTPIFDIRSWAFDPQPADQIPVTTAMDGSLRMAQGTLIQFATPQLAPGSEQLFSATAGMSPTGQSAVMIPYISLVYYASPGTSEDPQLSIESTSSLEQSFLPALFVCNLGWPDWIKIPF